MYRSIDLKEKPADFEKRIRNYWEQNEIFKKSIELREGAENFIFFEGPPTANGKPGIHHVLARAIKDSVCRYKTMCGFQVKRKAGWDTHGLPVEIEVEKKLGLMNKNDVEAFGIEEFNRECKKSVFAYEKEWQEMTKTMGYWIDLDHPYITLQNNYIETVWWILNQFFRKGLIYKGHKIVPYCPSCGTPLSSHEVAQGYQDVEDPSIFVKFKLENSDNTYFLAWTTTPWTLISNVALAVNPQEKYVKIQHQGEYLILAQALLKIIEGEYVIIEEYYGKDLEYTKYERIFDYIPVTENAFYIACAEYVSMEDGTGIVHTAPAFGQDDYTLGLKYKLPFIQPVNDTGKFTAEIIDFQGQFIKDADKGIIKYLKDKHLLYKRSQIMHSYPFCWRCKSPLIYYARSTWFIKTSEYKQKLIHNNNQVHWYPPFVGEKRFGEWLENNVDWALSRNRFWGTPLNIWCCDDCSAMVSIGSIKELQEKGTMFDGSAVPPDLELHRPDVDRITILCPHCHKKITRTPEVIDCWFDSGAMPFAQWHYPFENQELLEEKLFPAHFISEGIDQTRGWFYSLLAISTLLKGVSPYRSVLVNDLILDKNGKKMSKSLKNTVDPMELMQQFGADGIRWYLLHISPPWMPTKFNLSDVEETYSKFIGTLKNIYSFYITYSEIDQFDAQQYPNQNSRSAELDQWIFSKLHSLIELVVENNEKYDFTRSLRAIQKFVLDDLSNWYVRRSRRRYWAMTLTNDKKEAYLSLYEVLVELAKLIAPFAPFIAEEIFTNLTRQESVHLERYPHFVPQLINKNLEKEMQIIIDLVTMGRAARNQAKIKVRQPLPSLTVPERYQSLVQRMIDLIKEEINVKDIYFLPEKNDFMVWTAKVNLKTLGPKYGKDLKLISQHLESANVAHILDSLRTKKEYCMDNFKLLEEDLFISISPQKDYVFENYGPDFVALKIQLSEELIMEGHARELVNKIQFTRKENNFAIMDRIIVHYCGNEKIEEVFLHFHDYIASETLTNSFIKLTQPTEEMKMWDINGIDVFLGITVTK